MIVVKEVSKKFKDVTAVDNVSFTVSPGETMVLLGTSGSGKTTMLRMINRLIEPSSGSITINNENIMSVKPEILRRHIGYVLQGYGLFPHYTVAENIAIVPKLMGWSAGDIDKRTNLLMESLQLPPAQYRNSYPGELSGGQKQRVGLARALAADPPILLMDEPFGALDPLTRKDVRKEFKGLDELKKRMIILVTHDVQEAFDLGDSIALMDKGKLVQQASPGTLLDKPVDDFVSSFFADQLFQLKLQSTKLSSIWSDLPAATTATAKTISSDHNLWEAMNLLSAQDKVLLVKNEREHNLKSISMEQLQVAVAKV